MDEVDPYVLIRRAKTLIENCATEDRADWLAFNEWLEKYDKLPGAKLSKLDISFLADPYRKVRQKDGGKRMARLIAKGYLEEVHHVGGPESHWTSVRLSRKGRQALRLREELE